MKVYLGIDVGSVATKLAVLDEQSELVTHSYLPTQGDPIGIVQQGLRQIRQCLPQDAKISGVATTGSARYLAGVVVGADLVKNEITCKSCPYLCEVAELSLDGRVLAHWGGRCDLWEESPRSLRESR